MRARSGKVRKLNKRILILCEGNTEQAYFLEIKNSLPREKQHGLSIEVELGKQRDPTNLVNEAIRRKKSGRGSGIPFDKVWVVFDHDNLPNRNIAFDKAKSNGIEIAYSSINIEVWFILHFEFTTREFSTGIEAKSYFTSKHLKTYSPGITRIYEHLRDKTPTAIAHAAKLKTHCQIQIDSGTIPCNLNPYTTIDRLVEYILNL